MIESVQAWISASAVPNPHAILIHLPLALLPTALLMDLGCLFLRKRIWFDKTATVLYVLGTLGAAAAYFSGEFASEGLAVVPGPALAPLADHEDLGLMTLVAFSIVTILRTTVTSLSREDWRIKFGFFRLSALIAAALSMFLLVLTADQGGALVYRHGLAVEAVTPTNARAQPTPAPSLQEKTPSEMDDHETPTADSPPPAQD